jgi:hypothetical protein
MASEQVTAGLQCEWREDSGPQFPNEQGCGCVYANGLAARERAKRSGGITVAVEFGTDSGGFNL